MQRLDGLDNLESLELGQTQVTDAGLQHLNGLTNLSSLSLTNTLVTDAGLQHLSGLTQLRGLFLDGTQVTDSGIQHLSEFTNLKFLYLRETQVTDGAVEQLRDQLPDCDILHDAGGWRASSGCPWELVHRCEISTGMSVLSEFLLLRRWGARTRIY